MDGVKLVCPSCGRDSIEERGTVRYYGSGYGVVKLDGAREWVGDSWTTPIETLQVDELPFHCAYCGDQFASMDDLVPMPGVPAFAYNDESVVHVAEPERARMLCDLMGSWLRARPQDDVTCEKCLAELEKLSQARKPSGRPDGQTKASERLSGAESG